MNKPWKDIIVELARETRSEPMDFVPLALIVLFVFLVVVLKPLATLVLMVLFILFEPQLKEYATRRLK